MRRIVVLAAAAAAVLVPAASAQAGTICNNASPYCFGGDLTYFSNGNEDNNVTATQNADRSITVHDSGAPVTILSGSTCTANDANTATCQMPAAPTVPTDFQQADVEFFLAGQNPSQGGTGSDNDVLTSNLTGYSANDTLFLFAETGRGDDTITGSDSIFVFDSFRTGSGNDTINGRAGNDNLEDYDGSEDVDPGQFPTGGTNTFDGGSGDDRLIGGPGPDTLRGSGGDDHLQGDTLFLTTFDGANPPNFIAGNTPSNDNIDGGDGFDEVGYAVPPTYDAQHHRQPVKPTDAGAKVTLPDPPPNATTPGTPTTGNGVAGENDSLLSIEDFFGTDGADTIVGSKVSNFLFGGPGNDSITGNAGPDQLGGGGDDDQIAANDGEADRVNCGSQAGDKANVDQFDSVSDCPAVGAGLTVTPTQSPFFVPPDTAAPVIKSIKAPKKIKAKKLKKKGYKFTINMADCSETVRLLASLEARIGNKLAITAAAGYATLAEKRKSSFKCKTTMTLKIAKKLQKALKKKKGMRLFIQVTDQAGNTTPKRIKIHIT